MKKNVASQDWRVFAFNVDTGLAKTGDAGNITAKISKDFGALTTTNDANPTEMASGYYLFDLTQAETNADDLFIVPVSSTSSIQVIGVPGNLVTVAENFADLVIQSGGAVNSVGTVNTKTGYSLATNQRTVAIGVVETADALTANNDKTGYSLSTNQRTVAIGTVETADSVTALATNQRTVAIGVVETADALTANNDKTGYSLSTNQRTVAIGTVETADTVTSLATNQRTVSIRRAETVVTIQNVSDKTGYSLSTNQRTVAIGVVETADVATTLGANAITSNTLATDAINAGAVSRTGAEKIRAVGARMTNSQIEGYASGATLGVRSGYGAQAKLTNKIALSGTTLTVYRQNDTTALGTQSATTSTTGQAVTELDTN
jgi:hypothetical protein